MNLCVSLGKTSTGDEITQDLQKDNIHFVLLVGVSGSGKSIFHNSIYKKLAEINTPAELGFLFLDMTRVDFDDWESPFMVCPTILYTEQAVQELERIAAGEMYGRKTLFIHIEECNMLFDYPERVKKALEKIHNSHPDIFVVYSTSRPGGEALPKYILEMSDLKVAFQLASEDDSNYVLGNKSGFLISETGQKIFAYKNKQFLCLPFSEEESRQLVKFHLLE